MDQVVRTGITQGPNNMTEGKRMPEHIWLLRQLERRGYVKNKPLCHRCKLHHIGSCTVRCKYFQKVFRITKDCRGKNPVISGNA